MNRNTKGAITGALFSKGAYLVNAHGMLASPNKIQKTVPPNTVIYFLANPGYCLNIPTTLGIQNEFFTNKQKLYNFLYRAGNSVKKRRTSNITHVHNINTRIKTPGQTYLDMYVDVIPDKRWATMGYIKKLPTKPSHVIPSFTNVVPLPSGRYLLSNLLKNRFSNGGVFIISACRAIPHNVSTRFNEPGLFRSQPARGTPWTNAITRGEGPYTIRIKGKPIRKNKETLGPGVSKNVTRSRYPTSILKKLREAVTKNGTSVMNALVKFGARANLETRKPGELNFLKIQERLAGLPNHRSMQLRSGTRLRRPRT
jgi:hypothetical protein